MTEPLRVVIADDQEMVRTGFRLILEAQDDISVIGEASDGVEAVVRARRWRPDVCLMDIRMPKLDGLEWPPGSSGGRRGTRRGRHKDPSS